MSKIIFARPGVLTYLCRLENLHKSVDNDKERIVACVFLMMDRYWEQLQVSLVSFGIESFSLTPLISSQQADFGLGRLLPERIPKIELAEGSCALRR